MEPFRYHVFVCTQQKPEGVACCSASGSSQVLDALHRELGRQHLSDDVQVSSCGCLGVCDGGPVMITYPDGVWYSKVTPDSVPEIVTDHFRKGRPVSRLQRIDAAAMKSEMLEHRDRYLAMLKAKDEAGTIPDELNEMVRGFMSSRAVLTALELDLFTAVGPGRCADEVADHLGTSPRATGMLLNALVGLGLLSKVDGQFQNTALSCRFLTEASPDNARPGLLHIANLWKRWSTLTECVRKGSAVPSDRKRDEVKPFIAAMDRNARERAGAVVKALEGVAVRRMLDLGGGSAAYSIACARAFPELQAVVLDLPEVTAIADEHIRKAGLSHRIRVRAGDMLNDDLGEGYDLILLSAICHMFSPQQNQALYQRAHAALAPNGRLVIQDFILEPCRTRPRFAALFALNMLVGTEAGGCYTEEEFSGWLRSAGFDDIQRVRMPGPSGLLISTRG